MSATTFGLKIKYLSTRLQQRIWSGSLPLHITLSPADCRTYDDSSPYLINVPRLSYLPSLLPRLHTFFRTSLIDPSHSQSEAWLSFDGLPLKWHYPLGLLHDLFSGFSPAGLPSRTSTPDEEETKLPWRLVLHYTNYPSALLFPLDKEGRVLRDAFTNAVKEADFIRNGTAKTVMSLSKSDSDDLWRAVEGNDLATFRGVSAKLWDPPGGRLRHVPVKIYLPTTAHVEEPQEGEEQGEASEDRGKAGSVRVVQGLVAPMQGRTVSTLGGALKQLLPEVFPSSRTPLVGVPVLHGAVVPMSAGLEELGRGAAYADGFLHVVVVLLS